MLPLRLVARDMVHMVHMVPVRDGGETNFIDTFKVS